MITKFARFATATAAILLSSAAAATPITLNGSIANGTLLGAGTHTSSFDGTSVLPTDYTVNSASFSFSFLDNNDGLSYGKKITGSTNWAIDSFTNHIFNKSLTTSYTVAAKGEKESVGLTLGGVDYGTRETTASTTSATSVVKGDTTYHGYGCHNGYVCGFVFMTAYSSTKTTTQDWTGAISFDGLITNQSIINDILQDNLLNFSFNVGGNLFLTGAQLVLDITETPKAPPAEVPEPSSILLALAGLAGLAFSRRKAKRA